MQTFEESVHSNNILGQNLRHLQTRITPKVPVPQQQPSDSDSKFIMKYFDKIRSFKIQKIPSTLALLQTDMTPLQYFSSYYNNLCQDVLSNLQKKCMSSPLSTPTKFSPFNQLLPQCVFPPTIMSLLTQMLNKEREIEYNELFAICSNDSYLSLTLQYVFGLNEQIQKINTTNYESQLSISEISQFMLNKQNNIEFYEVQSTIQFLELLYSNVLLGEQEVSFTDIVLKLSDVAYNILLRLGVMDLNETSSLHKKYSIVMYLMLRGGLKDVLLEYVEDIKLYLNSNGKLPDASRENVVKLIGEFKKSKDYYALLLCHILIQADIIEKYKEIDKVIKYSLDDYIWYYYKIYQNNFTKLQEFKEKITPIIEPKYAYLYCALNRYEKAIELLLNSNDVCYQHVAAALVLATLCLKGGLLKETTADTFDLLLRQKLFSENHTFNITRFVYEFIMVYTPLPETVFVLVRLVDEKWIGNLLSKIVIDLDRNDILYDPTISTNQQLLDIISEAAVLLKPSVALSIYTMTGDCNKYLSVINDTAAVLLNDKITRKEALNLLLNVDATVMHQITDQSVIDTYNVLMSIVRLYEACLDKDLFLVTQLIDSIGLFPKSYQEVDVCVVRIKSFKSTILRRVLNGIMYEVTVLFISYLREVENQTTMYVDPNISIMKHFVSNCFLLVSLLPDHFSQQQFGVLLESNRSLIL
ncbi:Nuclear pore protein [Entamoeba marina]